MTETYRGWSISPPDMNPFWSATSPNYDASYEGPEDGWVDNGQKVEARTYKDLLIEIEDFIACGDAPAPSDKLAAYDAESGVNT